MSEDILPVFEEKPAEDAFAIFGNRQNTPLEETVVQKIREFSLRKNLEDGAAVALIYITGSRIEEITDYRYVGIAKDEIDLKKKGICVGDITIQEKEIDGEKEQWLVITTRVLKKFIPKTDMVLQERRDQLETNNTKTMEVLIDEAHPLYPLIEIVMKRIDQITGGAADSNEFNNNSRNYATESIYSYTSSNLKKSVAKYLKTHPHLFRHWRCKHLVENYGCSTSDLVKLISWNRPNMAMTYTESSQKDLEARDRKRVKERKENI